MKHLLFIIATICTTTVAFSQENILVTSSSKGAQLANFEAEQVGNAVQLSWTALHESDLNSHEIEKSSNGSSFANIGNLVAQNNAAPFNYTFLDASPANGNNYYRLRTTDKRGNVTYSNIIRVNEGYGKTGISVLPNPVQGGVLNMQLSNIRSGKYTISLYSNAGQKVFARSLDLTDGSLTETINLPQSLGRGMYFLQLTNGEMRINKEVILQ